MHNLSKISASKFPFTHLIVLLLNLEKICVYYTSTCGIRFYFKKNHNLINESITFVISCPTGSMWPSSFLYSGPVSTIFYGFYLWPHPPSPRPTVLRILSTVPDLRRCHILLKSLCKLLLSFPKFSLSPITHFISIRHDASNMKLQDSLSHFQSNIWQNNFVVVRISCSLMCHL